MSTPQVKEDEAKADAEAEDKAAPDHHTVRKVKVKAVHDSDLRDYRRHTTR